MLEYHSSVDFFLYISSHIVMSKDFQQSSSKSDEESFLNFRYEINKIFNLRTFVKDSEDFWLFVKKYECVKRKAKTNKKPIGNYYLEGV